MSEVYDGFLGYTDPMPNGIPVIKADKESMDDIPKNNMVNHPPHYQSEKHKNGLEDLKKARWYLNRLIDYVEKGEKE